MSIEGETNSATIAAVGKARVLAGAVSFKDKAIANVSDTYRGQIQLSDGTICVAIIKDISARELANEILAASIAYAFELPVPRCFVAVASQQDLPTRHAPAVGDQALMFASADVGAPPMAHLILGSEAPLEVLKSVVSILVEGGRLGAIYGFDTWAANIDRHIGNILLEATGGAWLIDHGHCFTGPAWNVLALDAAAAVRNRLKEWATPSLTEGDRSRFLSDASAMTGQMTDVDLISLGNDNQIPSLIGQPDFDALVGFLSARVSHVPRLAANALDLVL